MDLNERTISSQVVFQGKVVQVLQDRAQLPDGACALRDVVRHPGGAAVLALEEDGTVWLVRQFRYPLGAVLLEVPAGKLDRGEDPAQAARRELSEETGLEAGRWDDLGHILVSPGYCDERIYLYLARELRRSERHPDDDEFLDVVTMPFSRLAEQVMDGTVTDGKTVALTLKVKALLGL